MDDTQESETVDSRSRVALRKIRFVAVVTFSSTVLIALVVAGISFFSTRYAELNGSKGIDSIVSSAVLANSKIDSVSPSQKPAAINAVCKQLGSAVAQLGSENPEQSSQLRRLLIPRLLQMKDPRFAEAERQILLLNETSSDPQCIKWMALALVGQVNSETYRQRDPSKYQSVESFWHWLSHQPPGEVLFKALDYFPDDIRLIAHLVELAQQKPNAFAHEENLDATESTALDNRLSLRERVQKRIVRIQLDDGSHSLLVQHQFMSAYDAESAFESIALGASKAERRLLLLGDSLQTRDIASEVMPPLSAQQPILYRDFSLLLLVAQGLHQSNPQLAGRYYDCLKSVRAGSFPKQCVEDAYLYSGQLALEQGQPARAMKIWRQGIDRANDCSLTLTGAIAKLIPEYGSELFLSNGAPFLSQYEAIIAKNAALLANASEADFSFAQRKSLGRQILAARWRHQVAQSILVSRSGPIGLAIGQLRLALTQSVDVTPSEEINACAQLAQWYMGEGVVDNAAIWFERAVALAPESHQLRQHAAAAWNMAGNHLRASEQLLVSGHTGPLKTKLRSLELDFQYALKQRLSPSDVDDLRNRVRALKDQVDSEKFEIANEKELRELSGRLELLQACTAAQGVPLPLYIESPEFISDVARMAQKYRNVESVQRFAAEYLAVADDRYNAELALQSLDRLYGDDSAKAAAVRARVAAAIGRPYDASNFLISHVGLSEAETRRVLVLAANMAMEAEDVEYAYIAISKIAPSQKTCHDLFSLVQLSTQLPASGDVLDVVGKSKSELIDQWTAELDKREQGACGFLLRLKVDALISQLKTDRGSEVDPKDPTLIQLQNLVRELVFLRPAWPEAILIASDLSRIEGNRKLANRMLRDAIIAGESSPEFQRRIEMQRLAESSSNQQKTTLVSSERVIEETSMNNTRVLSLVEALQSTTSPALPKMFVTDQLFMDESTH